MSENGSIQVLKNGPLIVSGGVEITDSSGEKIDCPDKVALCRCGASSNKPFCDGTHKETGFCDESD